MGTDEIRLWHWDMGTEISLRYMGTDQSPLLITTLPGTARYFEPAALKDTRQLSSHVRSSSRNVDHCKNILEVPTV